MTVVMVWTFALLAIVRHYAGGPWSGDWNVHYQKALLIHDGGDPASLLDRPPAMNAIAAFYLIAGKRFETFQLTFLLLNGLAFLACCLIARSLAPSRARHRGAIVVLAALFMLNPLFVQNATYTWTKLFAAFYTIAAIAFYLAGIRKRDPVRLAWAFGLIAFGCLVHFAAVPYAIFFALHYLATLPRRRPRSTEPVIVAACAIGVLATWYGWTTVTFGAQANIASNPTIGMFSRHSAHTNIERVARNTVNTIVPLPLRVKSNAYPQPSALGRLRDYSFMIYEDNLFIAMGCVGGVIVAYLTMRELRRCDGREREVAKPRRARGEDQANRFLRGFAPSRSHSTLSLMCITISAVGTCGLLYVPAVRNIAFIALPNIFLVATAVAVATFALAAACSSRRRVRPPLRREQKFWRWFLIVAPVIGIAAQDQYTDFGLMHICNQPIVLLGLTLLAAALPALPPIARWLLATGLAIDFAIGILLHFSLQRLTFENGQTHGLLRQARINWLEKQSAGLTFWGDHFAPGAAVLQAAIVVAAVALLWLIVRSPRSQRRLTGSCGT
jgi:hypothetical protein